MIIYHDIETTANQINRCILAGVTPGTFPSCNARMSHWSSMATVFSMAWFYDGCTTLSSGKPWNSSFLRVTCHFFMEEDYNKFVLKELDLLSLRGRLVYN